MNSETIRDTNDKYREKLLSGNIKVNELHTLAVWLREVNNFLIEYDKYISETKEKLVKLP